MKKISALLLAGIMIFSVMGCSQEEDDVRGEIKRRESKLASNHFLMCPPQSGLLRDVHGVTQRREEEGRRQQWPGGSRGESKGERQIQPVISSLSVLHRP